MSAQEEQSGGIKYDGDKPRVSLIPPAYILGTADVLTFGARKYEPDNWRKGIKISRLMDATYRHLLAFQNGQDLDPESGLSHLYHASANLAFMSELVKLAPNCDDRIKQPDGDK